MMERDELPVANQVNLDAIFQDLRDEKLDIEMDISKYTSSITSSTDPFSSALLEQKYSESFSLMDVVQEPKPYEKPKRGRKPLRPDDPIRIKTEEKDKFWLRAFKSHMRKVVDLHWKDFCNEEKLFWKFYFSANGKPGKKRRFLSYGKQYKNFLFESCFFKSKFKDWFTNQGQAVLEKKYKLGSDEWFVYYNYCEQELFSYNEERISNTSSQPCPVIDLDEYDDLLDVPFDL
ncbi:hypothetical protein SteCoe_5338 [Stentor coeruleus]|uniref:Uncharacterized protein n=1 Tax=Stentor coeruleus TaxID=5963 RepID=A0A1R2CSM0_9CILI|nr:hypothetical protein SteCoe_5338 [Stentor coeruleus]